MKHMAAAAASGGGRTAEHIAWEQSVKDAAAAGGHKPDEHGEYRCRYARLDHLELAARAVPQTGTSTSTPIFEL